MLIRQFSVIPSLPKPLARLRELAFNLYFCWNPEILSLFRRMDADLWRATNHNPVQMLSDLSQRRLEQLAADDGFLAHLDRCHQDFEAYMKGSNWFNQTFGSPEALSIAYFSMEFGINEAVPIYSGGLGVLAGDHLKAASDLGLPLVGVSLLYRQGYFRQYLNADGWQQEIYPENDFFNLPVTHMRDKKGNKIQIEVQFPGRAVRAQVWKLEVGRTQLLLLDTNIPDNSPEDQEITAQLYGGGHDMRIKQELLLGIGGVRALIASGFNPDIYHMNEGHAAFLSLERIRLLMQEHKASFTEAAEAVRASNVFTTHTPVPAGNDVFSPGVIQHYLSSMAKELGVGMDELMALGRQNAHDANESFSMTVLAIHLASRSNGVSALHGEVARKMWTGVWPGVLEHEVPIDSITNGVHTRGWISQDMGTLYDRYLGPSWAENPDDTEVWDRAHSIPNSELWRTHERHRERLVDFARRRLADQLERRGALEPELAQAQQVLDAEALTIGFARRFATYKRGTLLLHDRDRLKKLLSDRDRPIQIIFAGKAHPADHLAKELIRDLVHFMRDPEVRRRIVFIEDYDMNVARYMLQGVDVWLNTPRRPLEASGTSGMKAAANGGLNLSILDGWWCEGFDPMTGWAIGQGEEYEDLELQDNIESNALYNLLEKEVVPKFYDRADDGLPHGWIEMMKSAIAQLSGRFSANRMVDDYVRKMYMNAAGKGVRLKADSLSGARELAAWKKKIHSHWHEIELTELTQPGDKKYLVGDEFEIAASLKLGKIEPGDVLVQIYHGPLDNKGHILAEGSATTTLVHSNSEGEIDRFSGSLPCQHSGQYGFMLRVLPWHESLSTPFDLKLIYWA